MLKMKKHTRRGKNTFNVGIKSDANSTCRRMHAEGQGGSAATDLYAAVVD